MSFFISRLSNNSIKDRLPSSFINNQSQPLICLVTLTKAIVGTTDPNGDGSKYVALNNSYSSGDLAFTKYGSLMSFTNFNSNATYLYYISPFDPQYNGKPLFPTTAGCTSNDVINGTTNGFVFNPISNYQSGATNALQGTTFVSPQNAQFILNVTQDSNGDNVYQIYFNVLQNPNLSADVIKNNLSTYCNVINNSDPMCFCDTTKQICTDSALGGSANSNALKDKNLSNYNDVQSKCNCLNFQCPYAANNQANTYAQSFAKGCNKVSACGINYTYSSKSGLTTSDVQGPYGSVLKQCGIDRPAVTNPPGGGGSGGSGGGSKGGMTGIIIAIVVILIVLGAAYYLM